MERSRTSGGEAKNLSARVSNLLQPLPAHSPHATFALWPATAVIAIAIFAVAVADKFTDVKPGVTGHRRVSDR